MFNHWKGVSSRREYLFFGIILPPIAYLLIFILSLFIVFGTSAPDVIEIFFTQYKIDNGQASKEAIALAMRNKNINFSMTGIYAMMGILPLSGIITLYTTFVFYIRRLRDIFGSFKIRYFAIFFVLNLIPFIAFIPFLMMFLMPGRVTRKSKLMDPVIDVIG